MDWKSLRKTTVTFKVDALKGVTFTLGFEGKFRGKYTLLLDETSFNDLPEFKDKGELPEVGHSIIETHNGPNTMRVDFLLFLKGQRSPVSIEHNLRSGTVSLDVNGKPKKNWQAKTFAEAFAIPYNFNHNGHKFSVKMQVDEDGNQTEEIELEIDGLLFNEHIYVDKDFGKYFAS